MLRRFAVLSLLLAILACGASVLAIRSLATAPFVAPGAADVQVSEVAAGERQITYSMSNPETAGRPRWRAG